MNDNELDDRLDDIEITEDDLKQERENLERRTRDFIEKNKQLAEEMQEYIEAKEMEEKYSQEIADLHKKEIDVHDKINDPNTPDSEKKKLYSEHDELYDKIEDALSKSSSITFPEKKKWELDEEAEKSGKEFEKLCSERDSFNGKVSKLKGIYIADGKEISSLDSLLLDDISNKSFDELYEEFIKNDRQVSKSEENEPIVNDFSKDTKASTTPNEESSKKVVNDSQNEEKLEDPEQILKEQKEMLEYMTRKFVIGKDSLADEAKLYNDTLIQKNEYRAKFAEIIKEIEELEKRKIDPEFSLNAKDNIEESLSKLYQNRDALADLYERLPKTRSGDLIKADLDKTIKEFESINKQREEHNKKVAALKKEYKKDGKDTTALDQLLLEDISKGKDNDYLASKYANVAGMEEANKVSEISKIKNENQQEDIEEIRRLQKELEEEQEQTAREIAKRKQERKTKAKKHRIRNALFGLAALIGFGGVFGFGLKKLNKGREDDSPESPVGTHGNINDLKGLKHPKISKVRDSVNDIDEYLKDRNKNITITVDDDEPADDTEDEITNDEEQIGTIPAVIPIPEVNPYKVPPEPAEFDGDEEHVKSDTISEIDTESEKKADDVIDYASGSADLDKRIGDDFKINNDGEATETIKDLGSFGDSDGKSPFEQSDKINEIKKADSASINKGNTKNNQTVTGGQSSNTSTSTANGNSSTASNSNNQTTKEEDKDANSFKQGLQDQVTKPSDVAKSNEEERTQKARSSKSKSNDVKGQTTTSSTEKETKQTVNNDTKKETKSSDMKQETKADMTR